MNSLPQHPFGQQITYDSIVQRFAACSQWEDRYRQLVKLSRELPSLSAEGRAAAQEIAGCENRVWLGSQRQADGTLHFYGDSEGRIVKGLLAVLLSQIEGQQPASLLDIPLLASFEQLGLSQQLSTTRNQGLAALVEAVHQAARQALASG